ncbi:translation initiation factor 2A like protein [Babesia gibsoni]|uniref:Eukaryotic translation initiation factor 2A n=1 Tax=Babesia gibsoni TaxID=33632 RepID=A0AAD8PE73_BABGI|nr:translation initiation factor 2A like protein [Babesia gibsoni]
MEAVVDQLDGLTIRSSLKGDRDWYIVAHGKQSKVFRLSPHGPGESEDICTLVWEDDKIAQCYPSHSGHQLCIYRTGSTTVDIVDVLTRSVRISVPLASGSTLSSALFSPKDNYLMLHTTHSETNPNNLVIYKLSGDATTAVFSIPYTKSYIVKRYPLWTPCEKYCIMRVNNDVLVWTENNFSHEAVSKITLVEGAEGSPLFPTSSIVSVSPVNKEELCYIGIFLPNQKKFDNGVVKIYSAKNLDAPLVEHLFACTEEGEFFWNHNGTSLMLRTFTNNVKGLSSYYGGNGLHLINPGKGRVKTIMEPTEGLAHDISWSKSSNELLIVRGSMPAELAMYDGANGNKLLSFGRSNRNTIRRDPFDRFILVAGFGNSSGDIDIWDLRSRKKIAQTKSDCSVICEFSPDGRFFVTATTVPRMRVNNCFKVFSYGGKLVHQVDFEELYHVSLISLGMTFAQRDPSPGACTIQPTVTKSLYRPPGSRGTDAGMTYTRVALQNLEAVPVAKKPVPVLKGPPGADLTLLNAAARIGRKKKAKAKLPVK